MDCARCTNIFIATYLWRRKIYILMHSANIFLCSIHILIYKCGNDVGEVYALARRVSLLIHKMCHLNICWLFQNPCWLIAHAQQYRIFIHIVIFYAVHAAKWYHFNSILYNLKTRTREYFYYRDEVAAAAFIAGAKNQTLWSESFAIKTIGKKTIKSYQQINTIHKDGWIKKK